MKVLCKEKLMKEYRTHLVVSNKYANIICNEFKHSNINILDISSILVDIIYNDFYSIKI